MITKMTLLMILIMYLACDLYFFFKIILYIFMHLMYILNVFH